MERLRCLYALQSISSCSKARQGWFNFENTARTMIESDDSYRVMLSFGEILDGVDEDLRTTPIGPERLCGTTNMPHVSAFRLGRFDLKDVSRSNFEIRVENVSFAVTGNNRTCYLCTEYIPRLQTGLYGLIIIP
jgi:hypothetical protein